MLYIKWVDRRLMSKGRIIIIEIYKLYYISPSLENVAVLNFCSSVSTSRYNISIVLHADSLGLKKKF